jgi:hypothetical protein
MLEGREHRPESLEHLGGPDRDDFELRRRSGVCHTGDQQRRDDLQVVAETLLLALERGAVEPTVILGLLRRRGERLGHRRGEFAAGGHGSRTFVAGDRDNPDLDRAQGNFADPIPGLGHGRRPEDLLRAEEVRISARLATRVGAGLAELSVDPTVGSRELAGDEPVAPVVARTFGIARLSVVIRGAGLGAIDESPRFDDGLLDDEAVTLTPSQVGS